jgi:hypothetical protein
MRHVVTLFAIGLALACAACAKPEPPDKEQQPEPQAEAAIDADATELRDAIQAPIDRAEAVEGAVLEAAEQQREAIEAATGD